MHERYWGRFGQGRFGQRIFGQRAFDVSGSRLAGCVAVTHEGAEDRLGGYSWCVLAFP